MKALSLIQPWAYLVAAGIKDVENRDWLPYKSILGQRIVIHASKKKSITEFAIANSIYGKTPLLQYGKVDDPAGVFGAAIGTAIIEDFVTEHDSKWFFGTYGYVMKDALLWERPVPYIGKLGFWEFPDHLIPSGGIGG